MDDLRESAIHQHKAGAKDFMATNDFSDGAFQDVDIKGSDNAKADGNVPARIARLKPIEVPEGLLCQARRETVEWLTQRSAVWCFQRVNQANPASKSILGGLRSRIQLVLLTGNRGDFADGAFGVAIFGSASVHFGGDCCHGPQSEDLLR